MVFEGGGQRALVAVLVVELVVPLQDELTGPDDLGRWLGGRVEQRLGLAELPGEVAVWVGRAHGAVSLTEAGGGLEAGLFVRVVERRAAGQQGAGRRRGRRDDGVVRLEGHAAAGHVFGGEAYGREGVGELDRRREESLERRRRRRTLGGRGRDSLRA